MTMKFLIILNQTFFKTIKKNSTSKKGERAERSKRREKERCITTRGNN